MGGEAEGNRADQGREASRATEAEGQIQGEDAKERYHEQEDWQGPTPHE